MKKNTLIFFMAVLAAMPVFGNTGSGNLGVGVILGEPTGISAVYQLADTRHIAGAAAWSFSGKTSIHLHGDYLFYNRGIIEVDKGSLPLYYGLGARIRLGDNTRLGVRFPLGAAYELADTPLHFFLELVPIMELVPDIAISGNAGIGLRYVF